jgi:hypothetical protein
MSNRIIQKPSQKLEGLGQSSLNRHGLLKGVRQVYEMNHVRSTIGTAVVLSVLGVGLVGCTSWKDDDPPPCDPAKRQQTGMASLSPTGCSSLMRPTYNSDH